MKNHKLRRIGNFLGKIYLWFFVAFQRRTFNKNFKLNLFYFFVLISNSCTILIFCLQPFSCSWVFVRQLAIIIEIAKCDSLFSVGQQFIIVVARHKYLCSPVCWVLLNCFSLLRNICSALVKQNNLQSLLSKTPFDELGCLPF